MGVENSGDAATNDEKSNWKVWLWIGFITIVLFFFIKDVVGNINGGGIFSIKAALHAANYNAKMIDVDGSGLFTCFLDVSIILFFGVCALLNVSLKNRWITLLIVFVMMGGAFIADAYYDEGIVTHLLAGHGYTRCENRDHEVGNGKSRVWFHNYVLHVADCPAKRL